MPLDDGLDGWRVIQDRIEPGERLGLRKREALSDLGHSSMGVTEDVYQHVTAGMQADATRRVAPTTTLITSP